jgi:glycine hydroxymethyltransferase
VNFSGKLFNAIQYGINDNGLLDYDEIEKLAIEHKPKMLIAGFSAYSQVIDWERMAEIAKKVNAYYVVDMAHVSGLVAADVYPSPVPFADVVTSTTHKTLRGPRGGIIICKSNPELEKKFNSLVFPGTQGGPLMHVIAAKAVAFKEALEPEFKKYMQQVVTNADVLAKTIIDRGYDIVSGGTKNHLMLVSLVKQGLTGKAADAALHKANITVNKNSVPNDPQSPFVTSGIRLGTAAITTRGFLEQETKVLGNLICDVLDDIENEETIASVKEKILNLTSQYPVYSSSKKAVA